MAAVASLAAAVLAIVGSASPAGAEDPERYTVTVQGPAAERPVLDQLELDAENAGTPLEEAIDQYVAELVGPDWEELEPGYPDDVPSLPNIEIDGIHLWELEDMKLIAARDGVGLADVIETHGWQTDFMQLADTIEASYPDQFSGAGITMEGPRTAWFGFKGTIPAAAVNLVGSLPTRTDLTGNKGFSEAELVDLLNQTHDTIYGRPDIVEVHGSYDIDTGLIEIAAEPLNPVANETARAQLEAELQPAQPANNSITVDVDVVDDLEGGLDDSYVRGGGLLNSGDPNCTAGFGVRHVATGEWGVATARHCADRNPTYVYRNHSGDGGSTTIHREVRGNTSYGDVAWYDDGGYTATRTFYYDSNKKRYVTSVWSPRIGVDACKFGRTTGVTCDTTFKTNQTRGDYKRLVATWRRKADGGDSGGPWYWGPTAYGIHDGFKTMYLIRRDLFTPAANLPSAMNVAVRTR
jgi:streptogrisin C